MAGNRFIERPVLSICISVVVVFIGLLALNGLSVEKFPNIAPPTVRVSATYMGASAETVQKGKNDYHALDSKGAVLNDIFQEIAAPIVQKWIQDNLPKLVSSLVEKELKKILKS